MKKDNKNRNRWMIAISFDIDRWKRRENRKGVINVGRMICKPFITNTMMEIEKKIEELKSKLTGNIFEDGELMMEIYNLKKQLNPEIETNPELDDDENDCLFCGS